MKTCKDCEEEKSLDDFYFSRTVGRYLTKCKKCHNKHRHAHRVKAKKKPLQGFVTVKVYQRKNRGAFIVHVNGVKRKLDELRNCTKIKIDFAESVKDKEKFLRFFKVPWVINYDI